MSTAREGEHVDVEQNADEVTFPTVVRGYERHQVDRFVAHQLRVVRELRATLTETEQKLRETGQQAEASAAENTRLRTELAGYGSVAREGFGSRAEKLLRLAEAEAAEMRASASRESIAMVERARGTAEQHRHEAEQATIARSREVDQDIRRRTAELTAREEKLTEQIAAGRAETERLREVAAEDAATLRDEAQAEAELIRTRARAEAGRTREEARIEQNRVTELRAEVHAELERLNRMILGQLEAEPGAAER